MASEKQGYIGADIPGLHPEKLTQFVKYALVLVVPKIGRPRAHLPDPFSNMYQVGNPHGLVHYRN